MKKVEKRPWNLKQNNNYQPKISLIIATYNEAAVIRNRLKNIQDLSYPKDKLQVIIVDSHSTDGTINICEDFIAKQEPHFPLLLLTEKERMGKSHALNTALVQSDGEIIATSDADSFLEPDALNNAALYFADPSIGAVTGREKLSNLEQNVHTQSEGLYRNFYYTLRLGESKLHSTLIFQGELSLYRRDAFSKFEDRPGYSDDTGTVIDMVSRGYRCIFVPDSIFYDSAAYSLRGRIMLKSRRAQHLIAGIIQSLQFKLEDKLPMKSVIIVFNFYLHVLSPIMFFSTLALAGLTLALYFQTLWLFVTPFFLLLLFKKIRLFFVSYFTSNLALIIGLINHISGRRSITWRKIEEMRREVHT
jgi:cellulose synthase/poly-beta-1,6-N-acetylglucosamine synthase-like glycosyltransferase